MLLSRTDHQQVSFKGANRRLERLGHANCGYRCSTTAVTALLACILGLQGLLPPASGQEFNDDEVTEIAVEAYLYAYPMVVMDVTRRVATNRAAERGKPSHRFRHARGFPTAKFTTVVRPNADTLYSTLWFDVTKEPLIVHVPDSGGRYYLLQMLDMWTDVFASPG